MRAIDRKDRNKLRSKAKTLDLRPAIIGLIGFLLCLGMILLFTLPAQAIEQVFQMNRERYIKTFVPRNNSALRDCKARGSDFIAVGEAATVEIINEPPGTTESITLWRCEESPTAKRRERENREAADSATEFRVARDSTTECDRAILYGEHQGEKCRTAETTVKSVQERDEAVTALSQLGAAAVQATMGATAGNIQSQDDAFAAQEQAIKASIAGTGIDLANSGYGAMQLSRAERDARAAASGIKGAQATYLDASNAAIAGDSRYQRRLERGGSLKQIEAAINADYDAQIKDVRQRAVQQRNAAAAAGSPSAALSANESALAFESEANALEEERKAEIANAHARFKSGISGSGIEETVENNFGTFENFRRNASKGVNESNAVAEAAAGAATNAKFRMVSGGITLATQIGQLRAVQRARRSLQDFEPPPTPTPVVAISGNPFTPPVGDVPPGPAADEGDFADFAAVPLGEGGPRDRIDGGVRDGKKFAGTPGAKPRKAEVSGGSGGGGVGGGGAGASRDPAAKPRSGPRSVDYAGGGGGIPMGGGVASAGGDTDFQSAIRSLLGGEKEGEDDAAKFDYYRKVASSTGGRDEEDNEDPRSIFERVKTKYNDVVSRGVI